MLSQARQFPNKERISSSARPPRNASATPPQVKHHTLFPKRRKAGNEQNRPPRPTQSHTEARGKGYATGLRQKRAPRHRTRKSKGRSPKGGGHARELYGPSDEKSGSTETSGTARSSEFSWYGKMLHDRFYSEWIQPTTSVAVGAKMSALVRIRIEKDGRVSKFALVKPSGNVVANRERFSPSSPTSSARSPHESRGRESGG